MARLRTASASGAEVGYLEYGTYAPAGQVCPACRQAIGPTEPVRRGYRRPEDAANLVPAYWHANRCPPSAPARAGC
ncbi:hypothetical protein GCM10017752_44610 [Streptomyces roseoviridis]